MDELTPKIGFAARRAGRERAASPHALRLAGSDDAIETSATIRARELLAARRAVAAENRLASTNAPLDARDPRWLVALETADLLEGAILSFERRRRVLALAQRVGVRPFDANLIIAAMQDRARRGEPLRAAEPVIALTACPSDRGWWRPRWLPFAAAALGAIVLHVAGLVWLLR
ncbi:MAG: hypothetical protein U0572_12280 [Phycisphaerales bacterium]